MDAVSAVIAQRSRDDDGLTTRVGWSLLIHVVLTLMVAILPATWLGGRVADEPEVVLQVTLGGAVGPRDGGLVSRGGRPVQEVQTEAPKRPEAVRAPAVKAPEMIEPVKKAAEPKKAPPPPPKVEAKDPRSTTPTKGAELQKGSAVAQTTGRGEGFGLSAGGGGTGGYLDVANFCCPDYLATMNDLIQRNWNSKQGAAGTTLMKFVIERDGRLSNIQVERSSGVQALDYMSQRALAMTRQLPPLPAAYTGEQLTVHLNFDYVR